MIIHLILFRTQAKLKLITETNYILKLGSFSFFHKLFYCSISILLLKYLFTLHIIFYLFVQGNNTSQN
jgi:hypothetical protein